MSILALDARKRIKVWTGNGKDTAGMHTTVNIESFLNKKSDLDCLNCLNIPDYGFAQSQPTLITCAFFSFATFFSKLMLQKFRRLSDNMTALSLTSHLKLDFLRLAHITMSRWGLLTQAGFVTTPHKDANGLCTWIYAHKGVKIWGVLKPNYTKGHSKEDLIEAHATMLSGHGTWKWEQSSSMYTLFLAAGDLL